MAPENPRVRSCLPALLGWLERGDETVGRRRGRGAALVDCFAVFSELDLIATVHRPGVDGELLGPPYPALRSRPSMRACRAFFTPMHVDMPTAAMMPVAEEDSIVHPACGAGGLARGGPGVACPWA